MAKILIIEDEEAISELIKLNLTFAGFETFQAMDGEEGLKFLMNNSVDLILLDIMLPKMDGYELLPTIVKKEIPVILLTAKSDLNDRVKGLNLGADDYITKPFESIELMARVNSVLRRYAKGKSTLGFDDININVDERKVTKGDKEVVLTHKEFELLKLFIDNKGIALSRDKILQIVWDYDYLGDTRTVDIHILKLRKKLETDKIKTVFKTGYRLEA